MFSEINTYQNKMKKRFKSQFFLTLTLKIKTGFFSIIFVISESKYMGIRSFKLIGGKCFSWLYPKSCIYKPPLSELWRCPSVILALLFCRFLSFFPGFLTFTTYPSVLFILVFCKYALPVLEARQCKKLFSPNLYQYKNEFSLNELGKVDKKEYIVIIIIIIILR